MLSSSKTKWKVSLECALGIWFARGVKLELLRMNTGTHLRPGSISRLQTWREYSRSSWTRFHQSFGPEGFISIIYSSTKHSNDGCHRCNRPANLHIGEVPDHLQPIALNPEVHRGYLVG